MLLFNIRAYSKRWGAQFLHPCELRYYVVLRRMQYPIIFLTISLHCRSWLDNCVGPVSSSLDNSRILHGAASYPASAGVHQIPQGSPTAERRRRAEELRH